MKSEWDVPIQHLLPRNGGTAPSLRVQVTAGNRALLRWLRSAELFAWQEADQNPRRTMRLRPHPSACQSRGV